MILRLTLDKTINGYWDYGKKSVFNWNILGLPQKDSKGKFIRVGSWEANNWFMVSVGKTEKQTLANAKRHLSPILKNKGLSGKFEYITE